jgi:hypothetical protein
MVHQGTRWDNVVACWPLRRSRSGAVFRADNGGATFRSGEKNADAERIVEVMRRVSLGVLLRTCHVSD